jgi:hypothetical protein
VDNEKLARYEYSDGAASKNELKVEECDNEKSKVDFEHAIAIDETVGFPQRPPKTIPPMARGVTSTGATRTPPCRKQQAALVGRGRSTDSGEGKAGATVLTFNQMSRPDDSYFKQTPSLVPKSKTGMSISQCIIMRAASE